MNRDLTISELIENNGWGDCALVRVEVPFSSDDNQGNSFVDERFSLVFENENSGGTASFNADVTALRDMGHFLIMAAHKISLLQNPKKAPK